MATNLNTTPYYDDFDETKNFYQILFRPGYAVQARELTQLQSIIKKQIERFGNHIFKHGSIVIPGNSQSDIGVPYAKLEQTPTYSFTDDLFAEGDIIEGATNGVRAIVKFFANVEGTDPRTVYFNYTSGGTSLGVPNGVNFFETGEEIFLVSDPTVRATIQSPSTSLGLGSLASIGDGVFYVNGYFAAVQKQTTVIDRYSNSPTCRVVLEIAEGIVTASEDETLLDPAQGSYNYAAPGADRLTVTLTLKAKPYNDALTSDYIEIMRYNAGELEEHTRYPKYSELEKSLAKRTFEESGNYRVNGLNLSIFDHKKTFLKNGVIPNNGLYPDGDIGKFVLTVSPGKAYVNGFGIDNIGSNKFILDKARTTATTKQRDNVSMRPNIGTYLYISDPTQSVNFTTNPTIDLYDTYSFGTLLGTCKVYTIDVEYGSGSNKVYLLGVYNLNLSSGYTLTDVGAFRITGGGGIQGRVCHKLTIENPAKDFTAGEIVSYTLGAVVRNSTVEVFDRSTRALYVYRHSSNKIPVRGDQIVGASSTATSNVQDVESIITGTNPTALIQLPYGNIKRVKDSSNLTNNEYHIWKHLSITTDASGDGTVSVSANEEILGIDEGIFLALGPSGIVPNGSFSLNTTGTTLTLDNGPTTSVVRISCVVVKTNVSERIKTLTPYTLTTTIGSGSNSSVTLPHTDIYKIVKVTLDPSGASPKDITSQCALDDGQRDFSYENGIVTYLSVLAASTPIEVQYSYFQHSTGGDFFSIDSYAATLGSSVYESIKPYKSSSGQTYDLANCLDFRFSGTTGSTVSNNYRLTTSLQYFVGYNVLVYLDTRKPNIILGTPSEQPVTPRTPSGMLRIGVVYIPPYVKNLTDIRISEDSNYRYTMADISKIDNRVRRLEYFSTLTKKEKALVDFSVIDAATGLDRFKSGLIVEEFSNQVGSSNILDPNNNVTYLSNGITANVSRDVYKVNMLDNSTNYKVSDTHNVTLDFTEETWASQPLSSTQENLNPYFVFSWKGRLTLDPSFDSFVETTRLPDVFNNAALTGNVTVNRERTTVIIPPAPPPVTITVSAPMPVPPALPPSPAPQPTMPPFNDPVVVPAPVPPPLPPAPPPVVDIPEADFPVTPIPTPPTPPQPVVVVTPPEPAPPKVEARTTNGVPPPAPPPARPITLTPVETIEPVILVEDVPAPAPTPPIDQAVSNSPGLRMIGTGPGGANLPVFEYFN